MPEFSWEDAATSSADPSKKLIPLGFCAAFKFCHHFDFGFTSWENFWDVKYYQFCELQETDPCCDPICGTKLDCPLTPWQFSEQEHGVFPRHHITITDISITKKLTSLPSTTSDNLSALTPKSWFGVRLGARWDIIGKLCEVFEAWIDDDTHETPSWLSYGWWEGVDTSSLPDFRNHHLYQLLNSIQICQQFFLHT